MAQLRRENLELRQQAGYWRSQHAVAKQQIAALEQEVAQLCGENRKLQDQLFGRKSETSSPTDRSNHLDEPNETAPPQPRGQRHDRPGPKRRDYRHLPVREEPRVLPELQRACPTRGRPLTACGAEVSEQCGDRNRGLSAADSTTALSTDLSLSGAADGHRAGRARTDPQGAVGRLGPGRDPARQVRHPAADRTVAPVLGGGWG